MTDEVYGLFILICTNCDLIIKHSCKQNIGDIIYCSKCGSGYRFYATKQYKTNDCATYWWEKIT